MKQLSIIEKFNTRAILSTFSNSVIYFMDSLTNVDEYEKAKAKGYKAFSDGLNLIDLKANKEGSIDHMFIILKSGECEKLPKFLFKTGFIGSSTPKEQLLKELNVVQTRRTYIRRENLNLEL